MGTDTSQFDTGHWLLRFVAIVIDSIIIGIVAYIIFFFAIVAVVFSGALYYGFGFGYILLFPLLLGLLEVLYFVILDVVWGGTIGKRIVGLHVQMVDGSKVSYGKAFIRNISKIFWLFLLIDWIIGVATPGADRRQKYTDRIAGTTVVSIKQPFTSASPPPPPPPPSS